MQKAIFAFFSKVFNWGSQKKQQKGDIQAEMVEKLSGKEIVVELTKLGFFNLTDESELPAVKQHFAQSKDKLNLFAGARRGETSAYTDNRFVAVDVETMFDEQELIAHLDKVKPLFEKLGLKLDYKNEKIEQTPSSCKHTIELNGRKYSVFDGKYSQYDWRIVYLNFINMLNSELKKQKNENKFYPIKCNHDGSMVLLTPKQFDFVKKHYPNDNKHPQKITDWEKHKQTNKEYYLKKFNKNDAVGWDSIDEVVAKLYPNQEPKHYVAETKYMFGGDDPLDGVSIYTSDKQQPHYHFISYGMSDLYYDPEQAEEEYSGWGFEFTFRLAPFAEDKGDPQWAISLMQNLAKYVFDSKKWFEEYHLIPTNGPIRLNTESDITAIAFVLDPELGKIYSPHGEVQFLQMVGLTTNEYQALKQNPNTTATKKLLDKLKKNNPLLITDINRK